MVNTVDFFWGVDSATAANQPLTFNGIYYNSLYDLVVNAYGEPTFWGRYIDQYSIDSTEIEFLHNNNVSIMPIFGASFTESEFESYVYEDGLNIATEAINTAMNLNIPAGTLIFFDLENWLVHYSFLEGLADGMFGYDYGAGYYSGGFYAAMGGTEPFNSPYCTALNANENMSNMYLYSNQPEPFGCTIKTNQPTYMPAYPSCNTNITVWQYAEQCLTSSSSGYPNGIVDQDICISSAFDLFWQP
ncbi:DUF1906 domain-containing protein (plasmid) [Alicyclobacillus sp. TC]|uniref:Rv2525c-like glycoside hydrolase-like domain-containing protein n=1 Tax=Alicyclobacillus tolerans TaxID=90970 RepID=A0ABT9M0A2_9BACL|nr:MULTISPECIES: glycoside hydrolase domain-containing protein [Alicyclobacillus]MDP9729928.1 hypothetical protein [Alicyclobacillus tengchongensis]QRF24928.1 DUF1906 domain-containing protein [Alicyclobacillus sp. TC]